MATFGASFITLWKEGANTAHTIGLGDLYDGGSSPLAGLGSIDGAIGGIGIGPFAGADIDFTHDGVTPDEETLKQFNGGKDAEGGIAGLGAQDKEGGLSFDKDSDGRTILNFDGTGDSLQDFQELGLVFSENDLGTGNILIQIDEEDAQGVGEINIVNTDQISIILGDARDGRAFTDVEKDIEINIDSGDNTEGGLIDASELDTGIDLHLSGEDGDDFGSYVVKLGGGSNGKINKIDYDGGEVFIENFDTRGHRESSFDKLDLRDVDVLADGFDNGFLKNVDKPKDLARIADFLETDGDPLTDAYVIQLPGNDDLVFDFGNRNQIVLHRVVGKDGLNETEVTELDKNGVSFTEGFLQMNGRGKFSVDILESYEEYFALEGSDFITPAESGPIGNFDENDASVAQIAFRDALMDSTGESFDDALMA